MSVLLIVALAVALLAAVAISRRSVGNRRRNQTAMLRVAELERENRGLRAELHRRAHVIEDLRTRLRKST